MTGAQALDLLLARCGDRGSETALRAVALLEMNMAQVTLLEQGAFLPWFLVDTTLVATPPTLTIGNRSLAQPTGFLRECDDFPLYIVDPTTSAKTELKKYDFDDLVRVDGYDTSGKPDGYALVGTNLLMSMLPDQAYQIIFPYFKSEPAIVDSSAPENKWLSNAPDLVIATTGTVIAAQHLQNAEMASNFASLQTIAYKRLDAFDTARQEANRLRQMRG